MGTQYDGPEADTGWAGGCRADAREVERATQSGLAFMVSLRVGG